jgi:murein L,D-transpeptidase YcbB/YkuD
VKIRASLLVCLVVAGVSSATAQRTDSIFAVVNIPAARVDVRRGEALAASFPVAVGTARFPTPTGAYAITEIVWNPWWIPPDSEWARDEKPMPPGPFNPMGRVKLLFAPFYFLHGTPDSSSIGRPASHGCVRMYNADAVALARVIMAYSEDHGDAAVPSILSRNTTTSILLRRPVSLLVVYDRFEVTDSITTLYPDPYRRGAPTLDEALNELSLRFDAVPDTARVRAFIHLLPRRPMVIRSVTLLKTSPTSKARAASAQDSNGCAT